MPTPLVPGDTVGVIAPGFASGASRQGVEDALRELGFVPLSAPHAFTHLQGRYAAPDSVRAAELNAMLRRPGVKAVIALRGGYGSTRLLPMLDGDALRRHPKWLVGYSDISALHAWALRNGVQSIHGPVASELGGKSHAEDVELLVQTLTSGEQQPVAVAADHRNKTGQASGHLMGGNLIVLNNLAQTGWDVLEQAADGAILFLEEVRESPYEIERMVLRLHQSGVLERLNGLIFGHFKQVEREPGYGSVNDLLAARLREWGYYDEFAPGPGVIVFGFPSGHQAPNRPLVEGASVTLTATEEGVTLQAAEK